MNMKTISNKFKVKDRILLERFFNDIQGDNLQAYIKEDNHGIYGYFTCDSMIQYKPDKDESCIIDDEVRWQMYTDYIQNMLSDDGCYSIREILYTDIIESNIITITKDSEYSKTLLKGGKRYDLH